MKTKTTICSTIKASWHAISRLYNEQAVKYELTTSIGFVLLNIDAEEGTPATKIGPLVGTESRSLTRMLKTLEEKGLIFRQQSAKDKRSVRIFLTDKGKEKREVAKQVVKKFNQSVKEIVPEGDLIVFYDVLNKISDLIETRNIYNPEK